MTPHIFLAQLCDVMGFSQQDQPEVIDGVEKIIIGKLVQEVSSHGDMSKEAELLKQSTSLTEGQILQLNSNPKFVQIYQEVMQAVTNDWMETMEPALSEEQKTKTIAFLQNQMTGSQTANP